MTVFDLNPKWAHTEKTKEYIAHVKVVKAWIEDLSLIAILKATYQDGDQTRDAHIRDLAIGVIFVCLEQEL